MSYYLARERIIIIKSCWQHGFPWVILSLSLSIHPYRPSFPGVPLNYIQCLYRADNCKFLLVGQHWRVHMQELLRERRRLWVRLYFSCCVSLVWFVLLGFEMAYKWPYSYYFVRCRFQDLFKTARCILVQFSSSFFSIRYVSIHVVHPYSIFDAATPSKNPFLFYRIDQTSISTCL